MRLGLTPFSPWVRIAFPCPFVAALITCDGSNTDVTVTVPVATVNDGLNMSDTQEYRDADLDGDGLSCGLGFTDVLNPAVAAPAYREVEASFGLAGR